MQRELPDSPNKPADGKIVAMDARAKMLCVVLAGSLIALSPLVLPGQLHAQTGLPGTGQRTPLGNVGKLPDDWNAGKFDRRTGKWISETARNIKWIAELGSQSFGAPVVASGKVFVGTSNNGPAYISRYPTSTDLGACSASARRTANSSGSIRRRSCRPGACTIGLCKASNAPHGSRVSGPGLSAIGAK
jgi:hypothetical protein